MTASGHFDVQLEHVAAEAAPALSLKTDVCLRQDATGWGCYADDVLLGRVPAACSERAAAAADRPSKTCNARIRSIQRDKGTKVVTEIQIRVSGASQPSWSATLAASTQPGDPVLISPELEDLEKTGRVASRAQLLALAGDADVRAELATPELQAAVAAVDAAPCREAALANAMEDPTFARFCDRVLDSLASSAGT